ncbi:DUF58 domain-containing protein [Aquabacterium sp. J223]|uniref:DUF58 domain-containing protein n=1 Tax=Aquabacterium sp. J223 TaxID=2898431 RepID=UPI0021AD643A|nr:DUF58 domain-containing protein [Aquabacterium sp. J223]UUX94924.1 DUF58 domain-containing protein [Aquabacterium sp. J223]
MAYSRLRRWWHDRLPATDALTLTQGNIYILPSKAGVTFALTLALMLVASINYQLSLGYALTFLLAGAGLTSMILTHRVLRGLSLRLRPPQAVFAGAPAMLEIAVQSAGRRGHGLGFALLEPEVGRHQRIWVRLEVPPAGEARVQLAWTPPHRGVHRLPLLIAETRYPFGLFRAWTLWRTQSPLLAYPAPEQPPVPLPRAQASGPDAPAGRREGGGDLEGVRAYQRGDALRRIVWKKAARSGELVSRDTATPARQQLWLDFEQLRLNDPEGRLSRLAAWVLQAEARGLQHGLRLPGREIAPGQGEVHCRQALEALALWS